MYKNNNTAQIENQLEILKDLKKNGKERPWRNKKMNNEALRESYRRLGLERKVERLKECGSFLQFKVLESGKLKLAAARFCQIRLCPICSWRRELKLFSQLLKVIRQMEKEGYRFVFLTLTCENVDGENLIATEDVLFEAFNRLFKRKEVKKMAKGTFRALEITHDVNRRITKQMYQQKKKYYDKRGLKVGDLNPNFNKYHPHFHVMIAVNKSYFTDKTYINQEEWVSLWKQSLWAEYEPVVDVRAVRNVNGKGISELAKYTVKDSEYIVKEDKHLTDGTVEILDKALAYRRLIAYGGRMKEIHKELNLSEDIIADVNIDEEKEGLEVPGFLKIFKWHIGYKNYVLEKIVE